MEIGDILMVDLSRKSVERKPFPSQLARRFLGGRGISAYWLCSEKGTGEDDFSSDNVLVMSCCLLTGTHVPASAHFHISAKSPHAAACHQTQSCHRCPVHCRAEILIKEGPYAGTHGERPDLEPIMTLGAKCGLDDSDAILHMHNRCNRLGIDSLSAGSSIAFAMEAFEKKDITTALTDGMEIRWGDKVVMEQLMSRSLIAGALATSWPKVWPAPPKRSAETATGMPITAKAWS